jgi:NADPH:quinone reductase-like Zn-dependent oxidoreductase
MKTVVYFEYGGPEVLQFAHVETPAPGSNQILFKVRAAALNPVDCHFVRGAPLSGPNGHGPMQLSETIPYAPGLPLF